MKDQEQQDEKNQIRLYEIMRGEEDTPYVAEASLDNHAPESRGGCSGEGLIIPLYPSTPHTHTPHNPECCGETKFDEHGFYRNHTTQKGGSDGNTNKHN